MDEIGKLKARLSALELHYFNGVLFLARVHSGFERSEKLC